MINLHRIFQQLNLFNNNETGGNQFPRRKNFQLFGEAKQNKQKFTEFSEKFKQISFDMS